MSCVKYIDRPGMKSCLRLCMFIHAARVRLSVEAGGRVRAASAGAIDLSYFTYLTLRYACMALTCVFLCFHFDFFILRFLCEIFDFNCS